MKSRNLSKTLFEDLGNEHPISGGTRTSCVGNMGGRTEGSGSGGGTAAGPPPSNNNVIAVSTLPSANAKYCAAIASLSPKYQ